jgi:hypothetical protein
MPEVGRSSPARRPRSVVFPLPDGPTIATVSPSATLKLTFLTAASCCAPLR